MTAAQTTQKTMSVTRGLATLKRLSRDIETTTRAGTYVGVQVGTGSHLKAFRGQSVDAVTAAIQSSYDSITSMIAARAAIKSAIVKVNATTKVTVGGKEITVAEAIEMKASVEYKRALVAQMQFALVQAQNNVNTLNDAMIETIDKNLTAMAGGDKSKVDEDSIKHLTLAQKAIKQPALIDPINVSAKIAELQKEIDAVDLELDFSLSEVNAKTEITVTI